MTLKSSIIPTPSARPAFLYGMARIMDIGGALNHYSPADLLDIAHELRARRLAMLSGPEAEVDAMRETWLAVGQSLRDAIGQFETAEGGEMLPPDGLK